MPEIKQTERVNRLFNSAIDHCKDLRHEFVMPEHLLSVLIDEENFNAALGVFYNPYQLKTRVDAILSQI